MFKRLAILLSLAPFAACGGKAASTADTTPTTASPTAGVVELGEITVFEGANAVLKIHASGATEIGGMSTGSVTYKPGPTVHTDGMFDAPDGKHVKLNPDGTVTDLSSNKPVPVSVTADAATLTIGAETAKLTLAADGTLTTSFSSDAPLKVQGADTAGKRKLTLALVSLIIFPYPAPAQPAAATPTPATPAK